MLHRTPAARAGRRTVTFTLPAEWAGRVSVVGNFNDWTPGRLTLSADGDSLDIEAESTSVGLTGSAKEVTALRRSIRIRGPELSYTLLMGAVGVPLVRHLEATLHRQGG